MKKTLSVKIDDYTLEVEDFEDWMEALIDIELGRVKLKLAKATSLSWPFDISSGLKFSTPSVTSKEQIICALILKFPKGLSKSDLLLATGMNPDSLATYLTSKQKEIAEGIEKQDDLYRLKNNWLASAMEIAKEVLDRSNKTTVIVTNGGEVTSG